MANINEYPRVNSRVFPVQRVPVAGIKPLTIIANKLSTGNASVNTIYQNIQEKEVDTYFGANSNLARALKVALATDKKRIINAIPLADGTSDTAATATITFAGTISKIRQVVLKSGNDFYSISVNATTTTASLVSSLNTAINDATSKKFSSSVTSSTLTLTALHKGTCGNFISLEIYFLDENGARINELTLTYSGFSGGIGASSIENALAVLNEFDSEIAIDTSLILDVTNLSALKTFLAGRLNSDNSIKSGFCYAHYIDSISGLTAKFGNNAFSNMPLFVASSSKSVSKTGKSGSEDGNYPLDVAVGIACINSAIVTDGLDVYAIMPHKPIGSKTNQGVARGGMILPGFSISNDSTETWTAAGNQSEIATLESLQINAVCSRNGNLEIGEMYTQSTEEAYKSFPEMSIVTRIQADIFIKMKQYKNQIINDRIIRSIGAKIKSYIQEVSSVTHDWLSDDQTDIDKALKSVKIERIENNPNGLSISFTAKTVNALKSIDVNFFANTLNL